MYAVRRWVSRHPRFFELFYEAFESMLLFLDPLIRRIGYERMDPPVAAVERVVKGVLFDTQMCGDCTLGADRHGLPDELPQVHAQRPVRRRARERPLRGQAGHALRVGRRVFG